MSVWKKWCLEKGIAEEVENYEPTQLNTLLEKKNKHGLTSETTIPFHRKWFGHRLNNSLNCLAELWTFLRLKDVAMSLYTIVLILRCGFDRTHGLNKLFLHLMRALLLHNYDLIFLCMLLIRNHIILLVQFGMNKHLQIFSKTTNCTRPTGSCNFGSLWKNLPVLIYSKLHSKSCDYLC